MISFLWDAVCSQRFGILKGDSYRKTETPNSFTSVTLPYKQDILQLDAASVE